MKRHFSQQAPGAGNTPGIIFDLDPCGVEQRCAAFVPRGTNRKIISDTFLSSVTVRIIVSRSPYNDTPDQLRHWQHIRALADEMHQPVHTIRLLYENALMHLKLAAKVQNFLPVFISKYVKRRARHFREQDKRRN